MVGIKDIAKKANVSISTVSYALNGSSRVSEKTREKILKIANELDYIPNLAGQNLRRKQTNIIGVYLSNFSGSFYGELLEGMKTKAKELGYDLIACSGNRARLYLPQGLIDGAIILDFDYPDEELISYADKNHLAVALDRKLAHKNIRSILLDNKKGVVETTHYLLSKDPNKIYLISGPAGNYDSSERLEYSTQILDQGNIDYEIIPGDFTQERGYQIGSEIGTNWEHTIAVFAMNDEMAIGLHNYFSESDKVIGKDVFIVGFDGNIINDYLKPTLASITYSEREWGEKSVEMLVQMIHNEKVNNALLPTHFKKGGSLPV